MIWKQFFASIFKKIEYQPTDNCSRYSRASLYDNDEVEEWTWRLLNWFEVLKAKKKKQNYRCTIIIVRRWEKNQILIRRKFLEAIHNSSSLIYSQRTDANKKQATPNQIKDTSGQRSKANKFKPTQLDGRFIFSLIPIRRSNIQKFKFITTAY